MALPKVKQLHRNCLSVLCVLMIMYFFYNTFLFPQIGSYGAEEFTRKLIKEEIISRFILKHSIYNKRDVYHVEIIKEAKDENNLSVQCNEFVKENYLYLDYMVKDEMVSYLENRDKNIKDPKEIVENFSRFIKDNINFSALVTNFLGLYLKSKGYEIVDFVEKPKEIYSFEELKAIAVRNVLPLRVTKDGKIMYKVCVAGEAYRDYLERNIHLEAFSFETIFNNLGSNEFEELIRDCSNITKKLKLSTDNEVLIKRAQGSYWSYMFQDNRFEQILKESYYSKRNYLPFRIKMPKESQNSIF